MPDDTFCEEMVPWWRKVAVRALLIMIALALCVAVPFLYLLLEYHGIYKEAVQSKVQVLGKNIRTNVEEILGLGLRLSEIGKMNDNLAKMVAENEDIVYAYIVDDSGKILYDNDSNVAGTKLLAAERQDFRKLLAAQGDEPIVQDNAPDDRGEGGYLDVSLPLKGPGDAKPRGFLRLGTSMNWLLSTLSRPLLAIIFFAALVVLGFVCTLIWSRNFIRPLTKMMEMTSRIADGDLTVELETTKMNEVGLLSRELNAMAARLRETFRDIREGAETISSSSEQFGVSIKGLAGIAEGQFQRTTEMASSIEEMASSINLVFENSKQTKELAEGANTTAQRGREAVRHAQEGMRRIESIVSDSALGIQQLGVRSQEIGKILDVIKEIAAQTNLLALNAAIEAARAGEHGRGFEVVAEEIRKLAEKYAQSTSQITSIIEEIREDTDRAVDTMSLATQEVTDGSETVGRTSKVFEEISKGNADVLGMTTSMMNASRQHASVSDMVASSVEEMSKAAKDVSINAEEMAATVEALSDFAEKLRSIVNSYKLH